MKKIIVLVIAMVLALICLIGCNWHDVSKVSNGCTLQAGTETSSFDVSFYIVDGEVMSVEEYEDWKETQWGWWR